MSLPERVQRLADAGYAVVPATAQKRPLVRWQQWTERAQTAEEQADLPRGELYAILTGRLYNLVVLDFDGEAGVALAHVNGFSPNVITGSGGWHVWFPADGIPFPVKTCAGHQPGMDVRGEGGIVYLYGTSSKGTYRLLTTEHENTAPFSFFPEKTAPTGGAGFGTWDGEGSGTPGALRVLRAATENIRLAPAGMSNSHTTRAAFGVGGLIASGELDYGDAYEALLAAAEERGVGDPERVIGHQLEAGAERPWTTVTVAADGTEWVSVSDVRTATAQVATSPRGSGGNGQNRTDSGTLLPWQAERLEIPYAALPQAVADLVLKGWEVTACPPEFLLGAALPALGAAIGGLTTLNLRGGWRIPPALYVALVGEPSTAKTPAMSRALAPVRAAENAEWSNASDGDPETRYLVDDVTTEKLAELLDENSYGLLMAVDELKGFFGGMGQYKDGGGRDRQFYLSAWSGQPITVDRIKRGSLHVARPTLTVVGGIQPSVFDNLTSGEPDGMTERFLMAWGDPVADEWRDDDMDPALIAAYSHLWTQMRAEYAEEAQVDLTPAARVAWKQWYDWFHKQTPPDVLAHGWNKVRTHVARIALILACCDGGRCDAQHIERAIAIVEWFMSHTMHVFRTAAASSSDERKHVKNRDRLAAYLADYYADNGRLPTGTEILQHGPPGSRRARDRDIMLDELGVIL